MAKSLSEIAAELKNFMNGRKLDLGDYNFDDLTILRGGQAPVTELTVQELRALLKENKQ